VKKGVRFGFTSLVPYLASHSHSQGDGAILVKTKQAVLVAEYMGPIQAGEATPVVENLADYLIGVGY
jgi:profilin